MIKQVRRIGFDVAKRIVLVFSISILKYSDKITTQLGRTNGFTIAFSDKRY